MEVTSPECNLTVVGLARTSPVPSSLPRELHLDVVKLVPSLNGAMRACDETWPTVYQGYAQGSDLSVDRCTSYELDGDARHNKVLFRFGHREGIILTSCV
jgi:hypothetical protein